MVLKAAKMNRARPFLVGAVATLIAALATATSGAGWASAQENGADGTGSARVTEETTRPDNSDETAESILVRRGLAGEVTRKGNTSFVMQTRFGKVHVLVNERTEIYLPPKGQVRFDELQIGDRVGVLLVKVVDDDTSRADRAEAGSEPVMRTATALKIVIVPDRATRQHIRGVVLENVRDRLRIIDERGQEREIRADIEVRGEAGAELLLIAQEAVDGLALRLRAAASAEVIEQRLAAISQQREEIREKVEEVRERVAEQRAEAVDIVRSRLAEVEVDAEVKARIRAAADELKDRLEASIEKTREAQKEREEQRKENAEAIRGQNSQQDNSRPTRDSGSNSDGVSDTADREQKAREAEAQKQREAEATKTAREGSNTSSQNSVSK